MRKAILLFLLFVLHSYSIFAQLQKWLIHETSGLLHLVDFTSGVPVVTTPVPGYGVTGDEDVNLMTDVNNNILFSYYANSSGIINVLDRNFQVMPNGNNLLGHNSVLKSGIVKIPCSTDEYYIINMAILPTQDLYYHKVSMTLNGGLGDVTQKNILLGTYYDEGIVISHQMKNGCRWLLINQSIGLKHYLVRFLITATGIGSPVILDSITYATNSQHDHDLQISQDNRKLVMATLRLNPTEPDVVVYDFDLESGQIFNRIDYSVSNQAVVGVEFSPSAQYAYWRTNITTDNSELGRIDLSTGVSTLINSNFGRYGTVLEMAGNGKMYATHNYNIGYLSEIANPDASTIAGIGFTYNAVLISPNGCRVGIPSSVDGEVPGYTTVPNQIDFSFLPTASCNEYMFMDSTCLGTWWEWDFGDGSKSNQEYPTHVYSASGMYSVSLRAKVCSDTLYISKANIINVSPFSASVSPIGTQYICQGDSVVLAASGGAAYAWSTGSTNQSISVNSAGTYSVVITSNTGCTATGSVVVDVTIPTVSIIADGPTTICLGDQVNLTGSGADFYYWSTGVSATSIPVMNDGMYLLTGLTNGCLAMDSIQITTYTVSTTIIASGPLSFCEGDDVILTTSNALSYLWNTGQTDSAIHVTQTGTYQVTSRIGNCNASALVYVIAYPKPKAVFSISNMHCSSDFTFIDRTTNNGIPISTTNWTLSDNSTSAQSGFSHTFSQPGTFDVQLIVSNAYSCLDSIVQQVHVLPHPVAQFLAQLDTCNFRIQLVNQSLFAATYFWDFDDHLFDYTSTPSHQYILPGTYSIRLLVNSDSLCVDTTRYSLTIPPLPEPNFSYSSISCDSVVIFKNLSLNYNFLTWKFNMDSISHDDNPVFVFPGSGKFPASLTVTSAYGCPVTIDKDIYIVRYVEPYFTMQEDSCTGVVSFGNVPIGGGNYFWSFGDGGSSNVLSPVHSFPSSQEYRITLTINQGTNCESSVSKTFSNKEQDPELLFIPNTFTPNGDNLNDVFKISLVHPCHQYSIVIYNRWGQKILESDDAVLLLWDGTFEGRMCPNDLYVYLLKGGEKDRTGIISIMR